MRIGILKCGHFTGTLLDTLGIHAVMFAFGHNDENQHAPDEFFRLPTFRLGQTAYVKLLERLGE